MFFGCFVNHLPKILESNGNAELKTKTIAQLTINCESDVLPITGRTFFINGIVYNPTDDVAAK